MLTRYIFGDTVTLIIIPHLKGANLLKNINSMGCGVVAYVKEKLLVDPQYFFQELLPIDGRSQ